MAFLSCEEMLAAARSQKITLAEAVLRSDLEESRLTEAHSRAAMRHLWQVMQATSQEYDPAQRSRSGLSGGDAAKVEQAWQQGRLLGDDYLAAVTAEALKTAECNACMKRIVAAPTAGSCGVLPAVLLPLARAGQADENAVCDALYVAAGFGQVIATRASIAGAEGGCQAEVGSASAMAAAALVHLLGGSPEQMAAACATAAMLVFQTTLNVLGSVDLLPLTGVTFPFVSMGGSSMLSCWGLLAYLQAAAPPPVSVKAAPKVPAPAVKPPQATGFLDELGVATDDIFGKEDAR